MRRFCLLLYPFGDKGRCNGLALDVKNQVLFAACANSGNPPAEPAHPMMVILSAVDRQGHHRPVEAVQLRAHRYRVHLRF